MKSTINNESPDVQFHPPKKEIIIIEDDEETPEASPNRNVQSPSLFNQLSKGPYASSPLNQSSDNDESPILYRKRKFKQIIQHDDEDDDDDAVFVSEKCQNRRLKPKSLTPLFCHTNSPIPKQQQDDDDDDFVMVPPSRNDLLSRLKKSSHGMDRQECTSHQDQLGEDDLDNPFIDNEAEKNSDKGHTDDELEDLGSSCLHSFIDDNSSLGHLDSTHAPIDEESSRDMYTKSLHKDDSPKHAKHWLSRFDADKWLAQQDDEIIGDTEEEEDPESIQDFSSDVHNNNINNNITSDDDFM